mgnify:CR=1 FL=1
MDLYAAEVVPEGGSGLGDLIGNPAISTPAGFALAVLMYLAKLWKDNRSERRADDDHRQTRESHIVDETKDILTTRREEAADLRRQANEDRGLIHEQSITIRELEERVARILRINERLLEDNDTLRETLRDGIGQRVEDRTARARYDDWRTATDSTDPSLTPRGEDRPVPGSRKGPGGHRRGAG